MESTSSADKVRLEFAQQAIHGPDDASGVHISFARSGGIVSVFLPLDQAARLLIGLKKSLNRSIELAKPNELVAIRDVVERERVMAELLREKQANLFEGL